MKKSLFILVFIVFLLQSCSAQNRQLSAGDSMPRFSLKNQNDSLINVQDYIGKKLLVIYFYPKDESWVCTKEACAFRDSITDFIKAGAMVIAINSGSVASHKEFQQKHGLPFMLLSDPDGKVSEMFGVKDGLASERVTFIVDKTGQIVFTYNSLINGKEHVQKALEFIREMKNRDN
jgi:peroxiredoxin Q/BCP